MGKAKVTFLMTAFNSEAFIRTSIESVLKQTEPDIRLVVRNNASTDGTGKILKEYAGRDRRVSCLENKKPYVTEEGIRNRDRGWWPEFDSEYVSIIDHDDILDLDFTRIMYERAKATEADMAICGTLFFSHETGKAMGERNPADFTVTDYRDMEKQFAGAYGPFRTLWGKLYRTELFETYYEESYHVPGNLYLSTDTWRVFTYLDHCKSLTSVPEPLYFYRFSSNSQFNSNIDKRRIGDADVLYEKALAFLEKYQIATEENVAFIKDVHFGHMHDILSSLERSSMKPEDKLEYMQEILKNERFGSYTQEHFAQVAGVFFKFIKAFLPEAEEAPISLNRFYIFRLYQAYQKMQDRDPQALLFLLSAVLDRENPSLFGAALLGRDFAATAGEMNFLGMPGREQRKLLSGSPQKLVEFLRTEYQKDEIEELEEELSRAVEQEELEHAADVLYRLGNLYPEDEYVVYYRMYLSCLIGEYERAEELLYAARVLYSYEPNMMELCEEILGER